jgi:hypothetical protein
MVFTLLTATEGMGTIPEPSWLLLLLLLLVLSLHCRALLLLILTLKAVPG